jgi:hypothetical protein
LKLGEHFGIYESKGDIDDESDFKSSKMAQS